MLTNSSARQPSRRKLLVIRLAVMAGAVVLAPLFIPLSFRARRRTAFDALHARVRQIWQTSPDDGIALLRTTYERLAAERGAFGPLKSVDIAPFGAFSLTDFLSLHVVLYSCEMSSGNFEAALAIEVALAFRYDDAILRQVDSLVALGRQPEAIALLERNLDLDGWRGKLRQRLRNLGGRHLRALS